MLDFFVIVKIHEVDINDVIFVVTILSVLFLLFFQNYSIIHHMLNL